MVRLKERPIEEFYNAIEIIYEPEDMESPDSVRVAVNIRPLISAKLLHGCIDCITVLPGEPQVQIESHAFTYDYVYGGAGSPSFAIYDDCVAPLIDALYLVLQEVPI